VALSVVFILLSTSQVFAVKNIIYILDASRSMLGKMRNQVKMAVAKDVIIKDINKYPDGYINAGLIAYGHREREKCEDIQRLVELKPLVRKELIIEVESLKPKGRTPIASSVILAVDELKSLEEDVEIILISDGKETCDPDPCKIVKDLKDTGIRFTLHAIGLDVNDEEKFQLKCWQKLVGGFTLILRVKKIWKRFYQN
jgi:Ca-activated chloride channel family protein